MRKNRRYREYLLCVFLLLLPILLLRSNLKDPEDIGRLEEAVLRIASPLQGAANWVVGGIGGVWDNYFWLVDVEDENDRLREANSTLREELLLAKKTESHVGVLEDLLGLKRDIHAKTVAAHIISASINSFFRVKRIKVNQGGDDVRVGMPVMSSQGLVGRILRTYGSYSDVLLVSDLNSSIDVVVSGRSGRGLLKGLAQDGNYICEIEYLEQGKEVKIGDSIVTSGLGEHFPEGLLVGEVQSIDSSQKGLYQKAYVKPAVDFSSLDSVLILLAPPAQADPGRDTVKNSPKSSALEPF